MREEAALVAGAPHGHAHALLAILGWDNVGSEPDDTEALWAAALLISSSLTLLLTAVWLAFQRCCCSAARRRRLRLRLYGPPPADSAGTPLDELWTIHNKRYDMRRFVAAHPGGAGAIRLGMGRNCTELYESYHSLANEKLVASTLARYYVEDAPPGARDHETRFNWQATPVFDRLKQKVRAHFAARRGTAAAALSPGHRAPAWQWLQLLFFVGASALALRSFTRGELLGLLALPFCYWWGPSPCMTTAGTSRSPAARGSTSVWPTSAAPTLPSSAGSTSTRSATTCTRTSPGGIRTCTTSLPRRITACLAAGHLLASGRCQSGSGGRADSSPASVGGVSAGVSVCRSLPSDRPSSRTRCHSSNLAERSSVSFHT